MDERDRKQVRLSDEHAAYVGEAVAAGEFASDEAAVGEALREWRERRDNSGYTLAELRRLVQQGIDSGAGRFGSMDELKAEARGRFNARRKSA